MSCRRRKTCLGDHLDKQEFRNSGTRSLPCNTLKMLLTAMEKSDQNGVPQIVLDEARMLKWMSEDATGRTVRRLSTLRCLVCLTYKTEASRTDRHNCSRNLGHVMEIGVGAALHRHFSLPIPPRR